MEFSVVFNSWQSQFHFTMDRPSLINYRKHFNFPEGDTTDTINVICKYCSKPLKTNKKRRSNLATHLKTQHKDVYDEETKSSDSNPAQSASATTPITLFTKDTSRIKKYSKDNCRQSEIDRRLLDWIACDLRPLNTIQSKKFKELMNTCHPQYQIPSRDRFRSQIVKRSQTLKDNIKAKFATIDSVCATADLWSNNQMRGYLGITIHWLTTDWTLDSVMLACKRFRGRHTGENISKEYDDIVHDFGLSGKVRVIVTDNTANMLKGFSLPSMEDAEALLPLNSDDSDAENDALSDGGIDIDDLSDNECNDEVHPVAISLKQQHKCCFAHTLQLCVTDGLGCNTSYNKVLGKVSRIIRLVRASIHASDILEGEKRLQNATATRWNSQLTMLRSIINVSERKLSECSTVALTTSDREVIMQLIDMLSPFQCFTDLIQAENSVTVSLIIPCVEQLKATLDELCETNACQLVGALRDAVNKRLSKYLDILENQNATFLDPRFKATFFNEIIAKRLVDLAKASCDPPDPSDVVEDTFDDIATVEPSAKKAKTLFSVIQAKNGVSRSGRLPMKSNIDIEFETYISEPLLEESACPLAYWSENCVRFPNMSRLARMYLASPASSGPVERLFSVAGKVFRPDRSRLADKTFECLMAIRSFQK